MSEELEKPYDIGEAWSAWTTTNEMDSKGDCLGIFLDKGAAQMAAEGRGWYGGDGVVSLEKVITFGNKAFILKDTKPIKFDVEITNRLNLVKSALSKLTLEERQALKIGGVK